MRQHPSHSSTNPKLVNLTKATLRPKFSAPPNPPERRLVFRGIERRRCAPGFQPLILRSQKHSKTCSQMYPMGLEYIYLHLPLNISHPCIGKDTYNPMEPRGLRTKKCLQAFLRLNTINMIIESFNQHFFQLVTSDMKHQWFPEKHFPTPTFSSCLVLFIVGPIHI